MLDTTETYIFQQIKNNDPKAFELLFNNYYVPLCRYCFVFLQDEVHAEEIVQQFFINLWENRATLSINTSIKSYLYKSVRNRCLNFIRNKKTKMKVEKELLQKTEKSAVPEQILLIELDELQEFIESAIASLPEKCRNIFEMSRSLDLSNKEIASALNLSPKTVENQITIALKKIKKFLDENADL